MMKRYLFSIILGILASCNYSFGQLESMELTFSDQSGNANGTVDVDVSVVGFENISGLQFSAEWDSLVMTFNSVVSTNSDLPDLTANNISGPEGAAVDEGQFSFSYNNPVGDGNLDDGEVMFTVRFNLVGDECDMTDINVSDDPTKREAFDVDFNVIELDQISGVPGTITINGADCGGGGGDDDLIITAATENVAPGANICIPLVVENFINVGAGEGTILWDPAVITYTGLDDVALPGLPGSLNTLNVSTGELKFVWSSVDGNAVPVDDGEPIFSICFDAAGSVGDMSTVDLSLAGGLPFAWYDNTTEEQLTQTLNDGKVTIAEEVGDPFTLIVSDATANMSNGTGCVDVSVQNFNNILGTQYVITWDPSIINNAMTSNYGLDGLNANSFNINNTNGSAVLSWNGNVGVDIPNGTIIYTLCFDLAGDCGDSSDIEIVSQGSTDIEILDGNTDVIANVSIDQGSLTIGCTDPCEIVNIDQPCPGTLGGNVTVNVKDGCDYSWANSAGTEISTAKNLIGVAAGTYILTVSCDGVESCVLEAVVDDRPALDLNETVTNAGCGSLGAINVNVAGGSGSYSYNWSPTQPNSPSISDLDPGTYDLTVTDSGTNCTSTASYSVITSEEDLMISGADVDDETCLGMDGSITLTLSGGCLPFTFAWSDGDIGNTPNAENLTAGNYSVTITDDNNNSVTSSYTVDGASMMTLDGAASIMPSSGSDGTITINVTGGTMPYSYNWSGPTSGLPNSNAITGLAVGAYNVTVTDASGCTAMFGPFTVIVVDGGAPTVDNVDAGENENGFSLTCFGDNDASITGNISNGAAPFTITLSGAADETQTATTTGAFSFDDLSAGDYTVTVSNSSGEVSENITIAEPDELTTDLETGCEEDDQCDGFIDLNADGGFGLLTYGWSDPDLDGDSADNLCVGTYAVSITDENGCVYLESGIDIDNCSMVPVGCYIVRNVITPNGDGQNDQFAVTCINDFPASLEIFDRYGKLVFNQAVYDGTWAGLSNTNEELIEGGYMYIINIDFGSGNREIMRGTITLLRD